MAEIIPFSSSDGHFQKKKTDESIRSYLAFLEEIEEVLQEVMSDQVQMVLDQCVTIEEETEQMGTVTLSFRLFDFRSTHKMIAKLRDEGWKLGRATATGYQLQQPATRASNQETKSLLSHAMQKTVRDLVWSDASFNEQVNHILERIESTKK